MMNPAWAGDPNKATYINNRCFSPGPHCLPLATAGRTYPWLRSPALLSEDITLQKNFPLFREGQRLEFKASAFNIGKPCSVRRESI